MKKIFVILGAVAFLLVLVKPTFAEEVQNPFGMFFGEITSWVSTNNIGVSGYYSRATKEFKPTLSAQLATTAHEWLACGLNTPVDDVDTLGKALGAYGGINALKILNKTGEKPLVAFDHLLLGYTYMYYFDNLKKEDGSKEDAYWDEGVFGILAQKSF